MIVDALESDPISHRLCSRRSSSCCSGGQFPATKLGLCLMVPTLRHERTRSSFPRRNGPLCMPKLTDDEWAMLRSQSGQGSGLALSSVPASVALRIDSHHFRVLLLRRLRLLLLPVSRTCRCGRLLDPFGTTAACSRAGVLGRRGYALESVGARICLEAGARVSTNVFVHDLDLLAPNVQDARRLEIVAEGLPLHGGAQLAVDTLVSAHNCDGTARPGAANVDQRLSRVGRP